MNIDLTRFTEEKQVIIPICANSSVFNGRRINLNCSNGWWIVSLGNKPRLVRKATLMEIEKTLQKLKHYRAYVLGEEGVATSFDIFLKNEWGEAVPVKFLNLPAFEIAKIVRWEDGNWYFYEADKRFQRSLLQTLKERFESDQGITGVKGITPELTYYFLLLNLQRQSYREAEELKKLKLSELEREKRIKEFQSTFQGRMNDIFNKADAELIRFYKANDHSYLVQWKLRNSDRIIKSTIRDDFRILNLGFCASGADKSHSISSAIQLSKVYGDDIYITRQ